MDNILYGKSERCRIPLRRSRYRTTRASDGSRGEENLSKDYRCSSYAKILRRFHMVWKRRKCVALLRCWLMLGCRAVFLSLSLSLYIRNNHHFLMENIHELAKGVAVEVGGNMTECAPHTLAWFFSFPEQHVGWSMTLFAARRASPRPVPPLSHTSLTICYQNRLIKMLTKYE